MSKCPCPVCGEIATKLRPADYDGYMFDCETCGRLNVAGSAFCRLKEKTLENRKGALEKAKRWAKGKTPEIDGRCI